MNDREHQHQRNLFAWVAHAKAAIPELDLLLAIPNGGHRHIAVARKMKAEGVRAGVPDLLLPVPRGQYHGLFIELKAPKEPGQRPGRLSEAQYDWNRKLDAQGYWVETCYGWEEAKAEIEEYLNQ